jgi:hypothetical protein
MFNIHIGLDEPAEYQIKIQGRLANGQANLADWFRGEARYQFETGEDGGAVTVVIGTVADQAALHGLLNHIRDLGLTLLYVDCLSARNSE